MKRRLLLAALPLLVATAPAQTRREQRPVYRCGNLVSDRPCEAEAAASQVGFDQPSDTDRRAALARAQAEQRRADQAEKARQAAEREALRANTPPARPAAAEPKQAQEPESPRTRRTGGHHPAKKPPPPARRASG